tara:strand:+ start:588 stop:725 length:138 start_codon:yes stop_codon:yes gene_type:complete
LCLAASVKNGKSVVPNLAVGRVLGSVLEPITCLDWIKKWIQAEKL